MLNRTQSPNVIERTFEGASALRKQNDARRTYLFEFLEGAGGQHSTADVVLGDVLRVYGEHRWFQAGDVALERFADFAD